jgi:hypothetical protein
MYQKSIIFKPHFTPISDHCYFSQDSEMMLYRDHIQDRNSKGKGS